MRLKTVEKEFLSNGKARLHAHVIYDSYLNSTNEDHFYFEFPSHVADEVIVNGNPWLALFLPISVILNENLILIKPVDPLLLEGCLELLEIWNCKTPSLPIISIEADTDSDAGDGAKGKTGTFFSGGLDSLHTLLRHEDNPDAPRGESIDELISIIDIYQFDSDTSQANDVARDGMNARLRDISEKYNKTIVKVNTNVWTTRFNLTDSSNHSISSFLTAIPLSLGDRYSRVLVPSTLTYKGSLSKTNHPLIDRLYSTTNTKFIPDASNCDRFEKLAYLSGHNHDLTDLHVCSRDENLRNCADCYKCVHSMLTLEFLGELSNCRLFYDTHLVLDKASRLYCSTGSLLFELESVREEATGSRPDIVRLVGVILQRSAWIDACRRLIGKIRDGQLLNPNDVNLRDQLIGLSTSGIYSEETRVSLDVFLGKHKHIYDYLKNLRTKLEPDGSNAPVDKLDFYALERALLSGSYAEATLDQQTTSRDGTIDVSSVIYIDGKPHVCLAG